MHYKKPHNSAIFDSDRETVMTFLANKITKYNWHTTILLPIYITKPINSLLISVLEMYRQTDGSL